jgi:hypothetical protein
MIPPQLATNVSLEIEGTQGLKYEVGSPREMEGNTPCSCARNQVHTPIPPYMKIADPALLLFAAEMKIA